MSTTPLIVEGSATEASLRRSEIRFRRLFEAAQDGILMVDPSTRKITDANPFIADLLGYLRAELVGKELWEIGLIQDEAASIHAFQELQTKGFIQYENLPLESKSGERREVEFVSNLYDEDGTAVIQCNIRDITARKKISAALRRSEERYRALFELGPVGVYCCDAAGVIQEYNGRAAELWGFRPEPGTTDEHFSGSFRLSATDGTRLPYNQTPVAQVLRGELASVVNAEVTIERPDASKITVNASLVPLKDELGAITGVIICFYDMTERKQTDTSLHLALDGMKIAQVATERASTAKDDFLAALSHELRTPLTPVLLAAATLRDDPRLPPDVREQVGMMERNIALEARLIDDLLDLTMIERGKLHLRAQPCDAHSLIGLALDIVREDARVKGVTIVREFDARLSGLNLDASRFQQVIWNLLRNAVKFTPADGRICVRTTDVPQPDGTHQLRIEIMDSGIGIERSRLEQIFRRFDQGSLSGAHRFGGLGLGLAIAKAVVDLHGGRITALSPGADCGATFVVELGGAFTPDSGVSELAPPGGARLVAPVAPVPLRLLLVEDHHSTLQTMTRLLRQDGHHVVPVATVALALAAAKAATFDFVISDLGLPDGSGNELMARLRDEYGLRGLALSGYGTEEDLLRSREAGFVNHLVKPVSLAELRRAIANLSAAIETTGK